MKQVDVDQALWQVTDHRSASPSYSLYFGRTDNWNFNNGYTVTGTATSPQVTVPAATTCFEFRIWKQTECLSNYDRVRISVLPAGTLLWNSQTQSGCANNTSFDTYTIDLSAYAGQTIQLEFYFNSGDSVLNNYEGVYLDDMRFIACPT